MQLFVRSIHAVIYETCSGVLTFHISVSRILGVSALHTGGAGTNLRVRSRADRTCPPTLANGRSLKAITRRDRGDATAAARAFSSEVGAGSR